MNIQIYDTQTNSAISDAEQNLDSYTKKYVTLKINVKWKIS